MFTIFGEFVCKFVSSDVVGVDDGGTTTGNHGPDAAFRVQDGELEGSTGGGMSFWMYASPLVGSRPKRGGPDLEKAS